MENECYVKNCLVLLMGNTVLLIFSSSCMSFSPSCEREYRPASIFCRPADLEVVLREFLTALQRWNPPW